MVPASGAGAVGCEVLTAAVAVAIHNTDFQTANCAASTSAAGCIGSSALNDPSAWNPANPPDLGDNVMDGNACWLAGNDYHTRSGSVCLGAGIDPAPWYGGDLADRDYYGELRLPGSWEIGLAGVAP